VLADVNLNFYTVFDTQYIGNDIDTVPQFVYWFPNQYVKAGDHVILYTTEGFPCAKKRSDGYMNYFFYWNMPAPLWSRPPSVRGTCRD